MHNFRRTTTRRFLSALNLTPPPAHGTLASMSSINMSLIKSKVTALNLTAFPPLTAELAASDGRTEDKFAAHFEICRQ